MTWKKLIEWPLAAFGMALLLSSAAGQSVTVHGTVLDPGRMPVAQARVSVVGGEGTRRVEALSDARGEFQITVLPGPVEIRVAAEGFLELVRRIDAAPGDAGQFVLQIAEVRESITVTESAGYTVTAVTSATRTSTPLGDVPQSVTVVARELIRDQMMMSIADVVRYVPGITAIQGENNRDQLVIRGNSSSADFFLNGVRDDVQFYRDLYNVDSVEALKGPNAMVFGRGGGGGIVNRVTKEAGPAALHEIEIGGGSFGTKRIAADFDQPLTTWSAFRFNGMYENSDSFRDSVGLTRFGLNPTLALKAGERTRITLGYEHFGDDRVADRGISSWQGRPVDVPISTYFGDPRQSRVGARVNLGSAAVEHQAGRWSLRDRLLVADYNRGYQNFVPGAVTADDKQVSLSAYNNATRRRNYFNQGDAVYSGHTAWIGHTLLAGFEAGRQLTDNFRNTGYFNGTATSIMAPLANPGITTLTVFRQSATDADNHLETTVGAGYVQDQIALGRWVQVVTGLRFDRFDLQYRNNRTAERLGRIDNLISPRAGLVFKLRPQVSLYTNYSVSYLPSSGDQFSSLTTITQQVKPEKFQNYEAGVKWDANRYLSVTAAAYRLNRTNTRSTDPNDPTRIVQTGSQRSQGVELGINGNITRAWKIAGGYAWQDSFVTSPTMAARAGAQVGQVPHHTFSLWNHYRIASRVGAAVGVLNRSDMFAAIDDSVILPGYFRADAAVYYSVSEKVRLQVNVENLLDRTYYMNADNNTNISPGSPRAVRVGMVARF